MGCYNCSFEVCYDATSYAFKLRMQRQFGLDCDHLLAAHLGSKLHSNIFSRPGYHGVAITLEKGPAPRVLFLLSSLEDGRGAKGTWVASFLEKLQMVRATCTT